MAHDGHSHRALRFDDEGEFDDQLIAAARKSPWWLISIGIHAALYAISTLVVPAADEPDPPAPEIVVAGLVDVWSDYGLSSSPTTSDPSSRVEPVAADVRVNETPVVESFETDDGVPFGEGIGEDGAANAPMEAPSSSARVNIGGSSSGAFRGRAGLRGLRVGGGCGKSEDAVEESLNWLAVHQSPDGRWECEGFGRWCAGARTSVVPDGAGKAQHDVGVTGLALLAFLGAGYTNRSDGPYGRVVGSGLRFLRDEQDCDGCFGSRASSRFLYGHAIAALAMVEAFGMTGSANYRRPAQLGLDFLAAARNPRFAWRYGVQPGDSDTSVTGWTMMAFKSARLINAADVAAARPPSLAIDEDAFDGIRAWVDQMTDRDSGRVGYQTRGGGSARPPEYVAKFPASKTEAMTAVGMLARIFLGEDPATSATIAKGAALCCKTLPLWDPSAGSIDFTYWNYGTLAMFQVGGEPWKKWEAAMKTDIVDRQRRDTDFCQYKGSWDPIDPWSPEGGRVYSTAMLTMCLEVWYRYDKVLGTR